jgi:hypothetical protein
LGPLDALIAELSHRATDVLESQSVAGVSFVGVLTGFRKAYSGGTRLDPAELIVKAQQTLDTVCEGLAAGIAAGTHKAVFDSLNDDERRAISRSMAARGISSPKALIESGEFLLYSTPAIVCSVLQRNPAAMFDGKFWDDAYLALDYEDATVTADARKSLVEKYSRLLSDAGWLASQSPNDLERAYRPALQRAALALDLLEPDST